MSFITEQPNRVANDNPGGSAFIIETGGVAAGVVVREGRKYRFFSASSEFQTLDGQDYASPRAAQKAADLVADRGRRRAAAGPC
jgi:hypothetical protein